MAIMKHSGSVLAYDVYAGQRGEQGEAGLAQDFTFLNERARRCRTPAPIVAESTLMQEVLRRAERVANTPVSVLLTGETGTGKSLLAEFIHLQSHRSGHPFIVQNCGALPETLCESELFGYRRGAFSGAVQDNRGLFEVAHGGTMFLDEVSEMSLTIQVKLLQVLQDGSLRRLGDTQSRRVDVRVIAASNKDLAAQVKQGLYREDLYYRLNVISIHVPPLRERPGDIPLLAQHFLEKYRERLNPNVSCFSAEVRRQLCVYEYPGNVRELENLVQRALVFAAGPCVEMGEWFKNVHDQSACPELPRLEKLVRAEILRAIEMHDGNLSDAARDLGISRTTLWRRMKGYDIGPYSAGNVCSPDNRVSERPSRALVQPRTRQ